MRSRSGALALLALGTPLVFGSAQACSDTPEVSFDIAMPADVRARAAWFELGVYRGASCEALAPMLANGVPESASARFLLGRETTPLPSTGAIESGSYAVAGVARAGDCSVIATACSVVDVDEKKTVTVALTPTAVPSGACSPGAVCAASRCVPAEDRNRPDLGAQCSLDLLGAGPLASAAGGAGTTVSAPAIAATPTGFIIVYREIDPNGTTARVTILPVDTAGGSFVATRPLLNGRCATAKETDGVGLVMNGVDGQIVLARSACSGAPGLELLSFASRPEVTLNPDFRSSDSPVAQRLVLSPGHVAARGPGASVIAFNEDGAGRIATIVPGSGVAAPSGTFGGPASMTGAWVAASDQVLALLSAGPSPGDKPAPQLAVILVPAGTSADQFDVTKSKPRLPSVFPGAWGSIAALGKRAIVVSDGHLPDQSVAYRAFDLDRTAPTETGGLSVEGAGLATAADIAMLDDKAYVAVMKTGAVSLHVLADASKTPRLVREVTFASVPRIPSIAAVRETGRVAVAATATRVAVTWTTASVLGADDPSGGYAVFACTP